jgi:hypothetical protein
MEKEAGHIGKGNQHSSLTGPLIAYGASGYPRTSSGLLPQLTCKHQKSSVTLELVNMHIPRLLPGDVLLSEHTISFLS